MDEFDLCLADLSIIAMRHRVSLLYREAKHFDKIPAWANSFKFKHIARVVCRGRIWTKQCFSDHPYATPSISWLLYDILCDYLSPAVIDDEEKIGKDIVDALRYANTRGRAEATSLRRVIGTKAFDEMAECVKAMGIEA
jgi:hypothetical protein